MKGTIHKCLHELIVERYGKSKWEACLNSVNLATNHRFMPSEDVPETTSLNLVSNTATILGISTQQLFDEFGEYWCCTYAPKTYSFWYIGLKNSKDYILKLDRIHEMVGKHFNQAKPPRFEYQWTDENEKILQITYHSDRNLMDLFIGCVKGVGKYFNEELKIQKRSKSQVIIHFP